MKPRQMIIANIILLLSTVQASRFQSTKAAVLADGETKAKASFYTEWATGIGSCGYPAGQDKLIVAMPMDIMADKGNCGKCVQVNHEGKSVTVKVTDSCPACKEHGRIDLSDTAFEQLASKDKGIIDITWKWVDCAGGSSSTGTGSGGDKPPASDGGQAGEGQAQQSPPPASDHSQPPAQTPPPSPSTQNSGEQANNKEHHADKEVCTCDS